MTLLNKYIQQFKIETITLEFISKTVSLILLTIIFLIIKKIINHLFDKTLTKSSILSYQSKARQKTILKLTHNFINYVLYFLLLYWVLSILGIPVSSLLAGAGIAGVTIGLGAQGFLSDVVNGFFILLENQYEVGDNVDIGTISGTIISVGIRTTQIKGPDGSLNFVPNRSITVVTNKSRGNMITHSQGLNDTMNIKVFIAAYLYTGHNHLLSLAWISLLSSRCIQPTWHFPWLFHI